MTFPLLIGILAAFVAVTLAAALGRAPTRMRCPQCRAATVAVQPGNWLLKRLTGVRLRWCQACNWQGLGRHRADWTPGPSADHDSGFRWGDDCLPDDLGFSFARRPSTAHPEEPPHHPSGFRFNPPSVEPRPAHPSGFAWAEGDEGAPGPAGERPGFHWGSPSAGDMRYGWGMRQGRTAPGRPLGFTWKDVG